MSGEPVTPNAEPSRNVDATLPVIRSDREAAAHLFPTLAISILAGELDDAENVQAFTRYRLSQPQSGKADAMREAIGDAIVGADTSNPEWRGLLLESTVAALRDTGALPETDSVGRDQGLTVKIEDGRLVISIGIDALMVAVEGSPIWENAEAEERGWTIDNPDGFANDIRAELEGEDEDGTTLVHIAIDGAIERAIEGGSLNIGLGRDG